MITIDFITTIPYIHYMEYREIVYQCNSNDCEGLMELLNENSVINALEENENGNFVHIYLKSNESLPEFMSQIAQEHQCIIMSDSIIDDKKYLLNYKRHSKPVYIMDYFTIIPPFIDKSGFKNPLIINPGLSFGTGSHATTILMLNAMVGLRFTGKSVLDIGCGSCILSIGASLMGARMITGIDIDDNSLISCAENADLNDVDSIQIIIGDIYSLSRKIKYDIILINMLRNNFEPFFADIRPLLRANGTLILTGFQNKEEMKFFVLNNKYIIKEQTSLDGWHCFVLQ